MLTTDMLEPVKLDSFLASKKEKILSIETTFFFFASCPHVFKEV